MLLKPYHLLILTALLLLISSFFVSNQSVDIHFYDTYYVIDAAWLFWGLIVILITAWLLYKVTKRILFSPFLTWIHILVTILTAVLIVSFLLWGDLTQASINNEVSSQDFESYQRRNRRIAFVIAALLLGQLPYFINLIVGFIKRARNHR